MSDLRNLSEAEWADTPGTPEYILAATKCYWEYRDGFLIPRSEYERVLALLAEAREALEAQKKSTELFARRFGFTETQVSYGTAQARATLSRIDDALAAEPEARS